MNPILMNIVVQACSFFALGDDDRVNPDAAVEQLEQISSMLKALSHDDLCRFVRHVAELAARAREQKDTERERFLRELPGNLGLTPDPMDT
jgi:hypothetical protein